MGRQAVCDDGAASDIRIHSPRWTSLVAISEDGKAGLLLRLELNLAWTCSDKMKRGRASVIIKAFADAFDQFAISPESTEIFIEDET